MSNEVIEALPVPGVVVEVDGRVGVVNPGARGLFGDVAGRHYITVFRQPAILDAVDAALSGRREIAPYLGSEARRDVTWQATCLPLPSGKALVILEDHSAVEEAEQSRRDFVANVSHELRTPLTALTGFIETLRGAAKDDAEARDRFLAIMEREAGRMNRLVADLLSLSRVEADERVKPTKEVDFAQISKSTVATLAPFAETKDVRVETEGLDVAATLAGDADQLSQVVTNLLENAIKYSPEGTTVRVLLRHNDENKLLRGPAWVLDVIDESDGIDPVHIPRLTERFYRIDDHRSRDLGGTGLGLAIVKHIVNRHRGRLRIESEVGKGSTFSVVLPGLPTKAAKDAES